MANNVLYIATKSRLFAIAADRSNLRLTMFVRQIQLKPSFMHTFFRGWRRKTGAVALVMAVAVVSAWCRSLYFGDLVELAGFSAVSQYGDFSYEIQSTVGPPSFYTIDLNGPRRLFPHQWPHFGKPYLYAKPAIPLTLLSASLLL